MDHHAIARHLAGRCDLEPQSIGDLPLQRMLGHRDNVNALHAPIVDERTATVRVSRTVPAKVGGNSTLKPLLRKIARARKEGHQAASATLLSVSGLPSAQWTALHGPSVLPDARKDARSRLHRTLALGGTKWQHRVKPHPTRRSQGLHLRAPNYCQRNRAAVRHTADTSTSHVGFRCVVRPGGSNERKEI